MGFTTGFTGGVTLTLGIAYLTVVAHERNRHSQALYLRSQSQLLNSMLDPIPLPPPISREEVARKERATLMESAKDRWNEEIENAVRWVQHTNWNDVREGMEGAVARLLGGGLQKSREGIDAAEDRAGPMVQEAVERSKAAAKEGARQAAIGGNHAATATIAGAERAGASAKVELERAVSSARAGADSFKSSTKAGLDQAGSKTHEITVASKAAADRALVATEASVHHVGASVRGNWDRGIEKGHELADKARNEAQAIGARTVDATQGAVRDAINKGIEKGKEAIEKAQNAVGLATEKTALQPWTSAMGMSEVDKALQERYEKPNGLDKTVDEVLAERYAPVDERDNTVLRGV